MSREETARENTHSAHPVKHDDGIKIKAHKLLILKAMQENRCQLSLSIEGIDGAFATIILAIDTKNNWLELDELAASEGHTALLEHKNYRASGWLKGINIDFTASIIGQQQSAGLTRYRSSLPDTIYQHQRRASYRTPVSMMSSPEVHLILSDNQVINAEISDISTSGALLTVPAGSPLGVGDKITQCIFKTLRNKLIIVEAEVKREFETKQSSRTRLGCRFINIDLQTTQEIQRYAAAVERLNARRR